ncbi:unnamed protein product, partial [Tetraodon nigroviridis]
LLQWLKHSRKEYCELCQHRFAFTPSKYLSSPSMTSAGPSVSSAAPIETSTAPSVN